MTTTNTSTELTKEIIFSQLESNEEFPIALSDCWEWLGYARKDSAVRTFDSLEMAESIDFIQFHTNVENSIKPLTEIRMTVDAFKFWAMSSRTARGKQVRLYYIQVEKEWKTLKASQIPVSPEHVEAYQFDRDTFTPWALDHPTASTILLGWKSPAIMQTLEPSQTHQNQDNSQLLELINTLGLAANRAGLAGNKSIKEAEFLDKQLDKIRLEVVRLQEDRDKMQALGYWTMRLALRQKTKNRFLVKTLRQLNSKLSTVLLEGGTKARLQEAIEEHIVMLHHLIKLYQKSVEL